MKISSTNLFADLKFFPPQKQKSNPHALLAINLPWQDPVEESQMTQPTVLLHIFMHLHFSRLADIFTAAAWASHSQIRAFNGSSVRVTLSAS